jgi:Tol biopolymer transport system component
MRIRRRTLVVLSGLVLSAIIAAAVLIFVVARDDDTIRFPGRIAVRDGCGLRHMYIDESDNRELCLSDVWAVVSLSRNGERLAWDTGSGIWTANEDGLDPRAVPVPPGANFAPSLSPDGEKMAFLHSSRDDGAYDLWVGSTTIDDAEQLTNTRDISTVAWSPTDEWIAYVKGWSEITLEGQIYLIRPNGDDEKLLTRGDSPAWSPDGSKLAFTRGRAIWTIGADGSDARRIVQNGESPAWSRDGNLIAFMRAVPCREPVCKERVFILRAEGGKASAVGPAYAGARSPLWLPDPFE